MAAQSTDTERSAEGPEPSKPIIDEGRKQRLKTWLKELRERMTAADYSLLHNVTKELLQRRRDVNTFPTQDILEAIAELLSSANINGGIEGKQRFLEGFADSLPPPCQAKWPQVVKSLIEASESQEESKTSQGSSAGKKEALRERLLELVGLQTAAVSSGSSGTIQASPGLVAPSPSQPKASPSAVARTHGSYMEYVPGVTCAICCEEASRGSIVKLSCGHGDYCQRCVRRLTEVKLAEGAAEVPCPQCKASIAEHVLKQFLPEAMLQKLATRSLELAVASATDLYSCPTPGCAMRVSLDPGDVARFNCPLCRKICCLRCGVQPYHRGLSCAQYAAKAKDSSKTTSKKRKAGTQEDPESSFRDWMEATGTRQCPACSAPISKLNLKEQASQRNECHKMMCRNCRTRFCFRCLAVLSDGFTCGCSKDEHGFCDPHTGNRVEHLRQGTKEPVDRSSTQAPPAAAAAKQPDGRIVRRRLSLAPRKTTHAGSRKSH